MGGWRGGGETRRRTHALALHNTQRTTTHTEVQHSYTHNIHFSHIASTNITQYTQYTLAAVPLLALLNTLLNKHTTSTQLVHTTILHTPHYSTHSRHNRRPRHLALLTCTPYAVSSAPPSLVSYGECWTIATLDIALATIGVYPIDTLSPTISTLGSVLESGSAAPGLHTERPTVWLTGAPLQTVLYVPLSSHVVPLGQHVCLFGQHTAFS